MPLPLSPAGLAREARLARAIRVLLALAVAALTASPILTPIAMGAPLAATRAEITAAMVLKFVGFVNWHDPLGDTLRVAVVDDDDVCAALQALAAKHNRAASPDDGAAPGLPPRLMVSRARTPAEAAGCHVLYLGEGAQAGRAQFIKNAHQGGALTVTAREGSEPPAVIRLFREGNRMRFAVDQAAAQAAQLKISSQLRNMSRPSTSLVVASPPWLAMG
jgi:hypothetical protein